MMAIKEFIQGQTLHTHVDTEKLLIAEVGLSHMNVTRDAGPIKISHRIVNGAGQNERKEVFEKTSAFFVVRVKKSK